MTRTLLLAAILLIGPGMANGNSVFGRWVVEGGKAVIEIEPCGSEACGRLVWMRDPWGPNGEPKRDVNNPDAGARRRPLCGLKLISGLEPAGGGAWEGGKIYSTRDGKTYGFRVEPDGPDRLNARGFLGISLLGQTRTWTRDTGLHGNCTAIGRPGADR